MTYTQQLCRHDWIMQWLCYFQSYNSLILKHTCLCFTCRVYQDHRVTSDQRACRARRFVSSNQQQVPTAYRCYFNTHTWGKLIDYTGNTRITIFYMVTCVMYLPKVFVEQSGFVFNLTAGSILKIHVDMPSRDSLRLARKRPAYIFQCCTVFLTATLNDSHDI